jgi:hypothetical protein
MAAVAPSGLRSAVERAFRQARVTDIHTHLYAPRFGDLLLWGIDELITYHYLIAETFRFVEMPYADFFAMPKRAQADLVWKTLFIDRSPLSEACRGVVTTLQRLGLDPAKRDLAAYRKYFDGISRENFIDLVFEKAGVTDCVMTNDPFDDRERPVWLKDYHPDSRFRAALRIDPVLLDWTRAGERLRGWGYDVEPDLAGDTVPEVQRFLRDWLNRTDSLYVGVSLPPAFEAPDESVPGHLLEKAVLPVLAEFNQPLALMIGVKRRVNPELRLAGDGVGRSRIESVEYLCASYPRNKFMVTMLSRENQHELCVAARKFRNLFVFGCWWFVNNPSLIEEMTRMRFELLGPGFVPQHSDARVLDQVIYKWDHSRRIIGDVLAGKYADLAASGWTVDEAEIARDARQLLGGNFWDFLKKSL